MREILFRGKKFINDEWVEGLLVKDRAFYGKLENHAYIVNHECPSGCFGRDIYFEVDPDTVGQYTGLADKNGRKIFERDVLKLDDGEIGVIIFRDAGFALNNGGCSFCVSDQDEREVIGNIHDNPELLKGGAS